MSEVKRTESSDTVPMVRADIDRMLAEVHAHGEAESHPSGELQCPACPGQTHGVLCPVCRGTGTVSAATFAEWHAKRQGR